MAQYPIPAHLSPQATAMWGSQYSTGARQGLATAQLVQQAIRQAQALQARQAELEMRTQQFAAQQELREREALRKEQELEIAAAYKETLLGLRERQLENQTRQEARKIEDAANRSAAMLKIQQQNADTARMRATNAASRATAGFTKVDLSPGHYMTPGGGHFYARGGNELSTAGENALRSGLASAQAVLNDSNTSLEQKAVAQSRVTRIMQQLGEEFVTEPMPGTGSPAKRNSLFGFDFLAKDTPAVPPTMTNYVRKVSANAPIRKIRITKGMTDAEVLKQLQGNGGADEEGGSEEGEGSLEPELVSPNGENEESDEEE